MNDALAPVTQGDTLPELLANLKELGGCLFDSNLPLDRLVTRAADEKLFDLQFLDRSVLARTASCMPEINRITNALGRHMTQYMTYVISPASSFVPLRNVRQLLAEIEAKRMALAENLYKAQTSLVDLMELRDRSAEEARKENPDVYKLARMGIRQQQIQAELGNARVYYEGALKDLVHLPIVPAERVPGRLVEHPPGSGRMIERWSNQTDSGQNRLPPSKDRWKDRSRTYPGIAEAMAAAWG